jgi:hypothetical protein
MLIPYIQHRNILHFYAMCDFPETRQRQPTLREASYPLALSRWERKPEFLKAYLHRQRVFGRGQLVVHRVYPAVRYCGI